jgi:DNA-binding MarR family transcriptional regulator
MAVRRTDGPTIWLVADTRDGTDPILTSPGYLLLKAGVKIQIVIDDTLAALDLTGRLFLVLTYVGSSERLSQLELSRRLGLDPTIVGGLLDDLEERGALTRRRDPADRRRHQLELTAKGRKLHAKAAAAVAAAEADFLDPLDAAERSHLRDALLQVMRNRLPWLDA